MNRYLLLMLPLALAACAKTPQAEPATPPAATVPGLPQPALPRSAVPRSAAPDATALGAHHWRLSEAKDASGQRIDALFANPEKPVQLDFLEGRVNVAYTCNRMGGAYTVEGDKLKFDQFASTMMACVDPKLMALDQEIGKRLQAESVFALQTGDAPTLTLTGSNGDVLTFKGEATAETRYGGPGETVFLEVAAQTKPCSHPLIPDKQCLQVREIKYDDKGLKSGADGEFANFYSVIRGYEHASGVRNVLRVKRYAIENPPADGSSQTYELDMVVESETVTP